MAAGVAEEVALIADAEWVILWQHNRLGVPFPMACLERSRFHPILYCELAQASGQLKVQLALRAETPGLF